MTVNCRLCGIPTVPGTNAARRSISFELCDHCVSQATAAPERTALLEAIAAPVLLMQGNPRQVVAANRLALALFGKTPLQVENHRGGQVFDCVHSFTEAGCGMDANCEPCKIKHAIVDTFVSANPHEGVSSELSIRKADGNRPYVLQVSTEKLGDLALVRIERYAPDVLPGTQTDAAGKAVQHRLP